jgi:uncharacterized protein (TIGR03067 family)
MLKLSPVLLLSFLLTACGVGHVADSAEDLKAWQGTWTMVSSTYNGQNVIDDVQWLVDGDHYKIRYKQMMDIVPIKLTLDASQKHLDAVHHEAPKGTYGAAYKGLYDISGNTLTVCLDLTGRHYPSSFDAPAGSQQVVYHFKRQ